MAAALSGAAAVAGCAPAAPVPVPVAPPRAAAPAPPEGCDAPLPDDSWMRPVGTLGEENIAALQEKLDRDPLDLAARFRLAFAYPMRARHALALPHFQWLVVHCPIAPVLEPAGYYVYSYAARDDRDVAMDEIRRLFALAVAKYPRNATVLAHAAAFQGFGHEDEAIALLERATAAAPEVGRFWFQLARVRRSLDLLPGHDAVDMRIVHEDYRRGLALATEPDERVPALCDAALVALRIDAPEAAARWAEELVASPATARGYVGVRAHNVGHTVLGVLALGRGALDEAKEHLRASADIAEKDTHVPPEAELARALLAAGEKDAVYDYVVSCMRWSDDPRLERWRGALAEGTRLPWDAFRK